MQRLLPRRLIAMFVAFVPALTACGQVFDNTVSVPRDYVGLTTHQWPEPYPWGSGASPAPAFAYGAIRLHDYWWWASIETADGVFDWSRVDRWIEANKGKTCVLTIYGTPPFHATNGQHKPKGYNFPAGNSIPSYPALARFAVELAKRAQGKCEPVIETWNEISTAADGPHHFFSSPDPVVWCRMTKVVFDAVKAYDPSIRVLAPSQVDWSGLVTKYAQACNTLGVKPDGFPYHFYGIRSDSVAKKIDEIRAALDAAGWQDVPLYNSEFGYLDGKAPSADEMKAILTIAAMKGMKMMVAFSYDNPHEKHLFGDLSNNKEMQDALEWAHKNVAGRTITKAVIERKGAIRLTYASAAAAE